MAEKLCLQWYDFQDNVKNVFGYLRDTTDFVDVTHTCEDGQHIEAHKVILAACSRGPGCLQPVPPNGKLIKVD